MALRGLVAGEPGNGHNRRSDGPPEEARCRRPKERRAVVFLGAELAPKQTDEAEYQNEHADHPQSIQHIVSAPGSHPPPEGGEPDPGREADRSIVIAGAHGKNPRQSKARAAGILATV